MPRGAGGTRIGSAPRETAVGQRADGADRLSFQPRDFAALVQPADRDAERKREQDDADGRDAEHRRRASDVSRAFQSVADTSNRRYRAGPSGRSILRRNSHTWVSIVFVEPNQCSSQIDARRSVRCTTSPALRASIKSSSNSLTDSSIGVTA